MKSITSTITILALAALVAGCEQKPTAAQEMEKIETKTKDAVQDMQDYTFAQKSEFTAKMRLQLAEIKIDLDQLEAKIEKSSDAAKADAKPKLKALRDQESELNKQLDQVANATESTWDDVKKGTKKAYESLKDGFMQSRQWVSEKIAP
jgi:PBP1b-binding outer membrane lipoprotein LpoB